MRESFRQFLARSQWLSAALASFFSIIIVWFLGTHTQILSGFEGHLLKTQSENISHSDIGKDFILVVVSERDLARRATSNGTPINVPRREQAKFIHLIRSAGVKYLYIDLMYVTKSTTGDEELKQALSEPGPPIMMAATPPKVPVETRTIPNSYVYPAIIDEVPRSVVLVTPRTIGGEGTASGIRLFDRMSGKPGSTYILSASVIGLMIDYGLKPEPEGLDIKSDSITIRANKIKLETFTEGNLLLMQARGYNYLIKEMEFDQAMRILENSVNAKSVFKNKRVVLGVYSDKDGISDNVKTGAEFMARSMAYISERYGTLLIEIPRNLRHSLQFIASFLAFILTYRRGVFGAFLAFIIFTPALYFGSQYALISFSAMIQPFRFWSVIILCITCALVVRNETGWKFVPEQVRAGITGKEVKKATVMLFDIVASTQMAQQLGPRGTKDAFTKALNEAGEIVHAHGGIIERVLGDGALAIFYGSVEQVGAKAIACAQKMIGQASEQFPLTIGLVSGEVAGGLVQVGDFHDYSSFGETIHLAARLQSSCKTTGENVLLDSNLASAYPELTLSKGEHPLQGFGSTEVFGLK